MSLKILLVDSSRTIRNIQKNTLKMLGHTEVTEASDGLQALKAIAKQRPDLLLVDWNMPNMDGLALIRKVRETDNKLPIIMVTTEAEKSRVLEALKAGVNNYVVKPFTPETLGEKITQTMSKVVGPAATNATTPAPVPAAVSEPIPSTVAAPSTTPQTTPAPALAH
ncbi:MAG TPA: response regulator [Phycisphaerae bacterium]|nr:response regulator [Phycisphaerae bacterium]